MMKISTNKTTRAAGAVLGALLLGAAGAAQATYVYWDGGAEDGLWSSGVNWDTDTVPSTNDVAFITDGSTVDYSSWTNANLYAFRVQNGTLNIDSGYLEATAYTKWWDCWVGANSSVTGMVNQTGGKAVLGFVEIGRNQNSYGIYNLSGGELDITYVSRTSGYHFFVGTPDSRNGGGYGLFEISNDAVFSTRYGVQIGSSLTIGSVAYATNGTFSVVGSDCSIDIGNYPSNSTAGAWYQCTGNTLKLGIDEGGISPITIHGGDATFEYQAELVPYFVDGVTPEAGKWTVMYATNGTISADGLSLPDSVDADMWNFGVTNGNELWVSYGQGGWEGLTVPAAPSSLIARPTGPLEASLEWSAPEGTVTGYSIKRSTVSGGPYTTVATDVVETSYTDTVPATDTTYYYVVSANNDYGEGEDSSEDAAVVIDATILFSYGSDYGTIYEAYSLFDDDESTHWDSIADAWAGLDYGSDNAKEIVQVRYILRKYSEASVLPYASNCTFEAANSSDWSDAVTLHTVPVDVLTGYEGWNSFEVSGGTAYRYFRVVSAPGLKNKAFAEIMVLTTEDFTSNGTPLYWLEDSGLTEADDEVDNDGDGLMTWEEYVAGTDPTDAADVLKMTDFSMTNGLVITWNSVEGKTYSVVTNTSLSVGESGVMDTVTGLDGSTSYTGSVSSASAVFYSIGVE